MFTINVAPSGQQIRLVRVRKLARRGLSNGVTIRRIKKKGNGIAALDQMLSESSWKLFCRDGAERWFYHFVCFGTRMEKKEPVSD